MTKNNIEIIYLFLFSLIPISIIIGSSISLININIAFYSFILTIIVAFVMITLISYKGWSGYYTIPKSWAKDNYEKYKKIITNEINNELDLAETMNEFFSNVVSKLGIKGYQNESSSIGHDQTPNLRHDKVDHAISKFKDHPSIIKIKERTKINEKFTFSMSNVDDIATIIKSLNINISGLPHSP